MAGPAAITATQVTCSDENYPVESLEESLAEGIGTGHPGMPEFQLEPDQIGDFIAFLKSLEPTAE